MLAAAARFAEKKTYLRDFLTRIARDGGEENFPAPHDRRRPAEAGHFRRPREIFRRAPLHRQRLARRKPIRARPAKERPV